MPKLYLAIVMAFLPIIALANPYSSSQDYAPSVKEIEGYYYESLSGPKCSTPTCEALRQSANNFCNGKKDTVNSSCKGKTSRYECDSFTSTPVSDNRYKTDYRVQRFYRSYSTAQDGQSCTFKEWEVISTFNDSFDVYKKTVSTPTCPPDDNKDATHGYDSGDGNGLRCYEPDELASNTDCSSVTDKVYNKDFGTDMCIVGPQGGQLAKCQLTFDWAALGDENNPMYFYKPASKNNCYGAKEGDYQKPQSGDGGDANLPVDDSTPDNTCVDYVGSKVCTSSEEAVCSDGVCPSNCGEINGDFYCFGDDDNNNGIADHTENDGLGSDENNGGEGNGNGGEGNGNGGEGNGNGNGNGGDSDINVDLGELVDDSGFPDSDSFSSMIDKKISDAKKDVTSQLDGDSNLKKIQTIFTDKGFMATFGNALDFIKPYPCQDVMVPFTNVEFGICSVADKVRPIIHIIFMVMTVIYIMRRLNDTIIFGSRY